MFTVKNLIILLVGFVLGYFMKVQAKQTVTMGYDDYKLSQWQSNVNKSDIDTNEDDNDSQVIQDNKDTQSDISESK